MRGVKCVISILLLCCIPALAKDNAQKLYESGQYDEAINKYNRILIEHPDWEEVHFGKGSALYKSEKIDEAMREFELAISSKDPLQKSAVYYNMGNALIKSERLEESLRFYKRALELNPQDYDAKHNFELVRQMMQQQNQNQSQQQDQNGKKDQQKQQKNDQQDKKEKQEQQQSQPQQTPQKQRQGRQKSQEEAAQVLDALKDDEKKMMQERMKTKYSGIKKEKDW
ncbi:MAG: tetratricopeptide repeat protein [Candidatus Marinimicrobia bacterium]|nr:tetratricopeptide repeat protein [Candidatus Neomarinimicrobiota bacterium]MBL7066928.1 tetratricopeptide repeat protein [Candidatus Neomarinimicrobiota bacterium]